MKDVIKLKRPVRIDGKDVCELNYDTDEISLDLLTEAEAWKSKKTGADTMSLAEVDNNYHLFVGMAAVIAVMPKCTFEDLSRIKGFDLMQIRAVGRNFTLGSEQESTPDGSDEQSEITQESTTLQ